MRLYFAPVMSVLLTGSLLSTTGSLFAQSNNAPVDPKEMLAELAQLKDKQAQSAKTQLTTTLKDFTAAATNDSTALGFYMEAIRVTQFVGRDREVTSFVEWKKKEVPKLNGTAIRVCLEYMVISMWRASGETDAQVFPNVLAYAQEVQPLLGSIYNQEIVQASITSNVFARWYNLNGALSKLENWEMTPGNVDGIYTSFLMPYMRKTKDARLIQYWDNKLADETARASSATAAFSTDRFNQTRRPEILWNRAEDLIVIGSRDEGLNDMFGIVKNYPDHPQAGQWIAELKGLLAPATTAVKAGP